MQPARATGFSPEQTAQARKWLERRTEEAVRSYLWASLVAVVFVFAPVVFGIAAWLVRRGGRALSERGVLVPARLVEYAGDGSSSSAAETAGTQANVLPGLSTDVAAIGVEQAFRGANVLLIALGRYLPACIVHFEFELAGRRLRGHHYMFSDERFFRDERGQLRALVDPKSPRLVSWLVSRRQCW
jgi:hypothetical protein